MQADTFIEAFTSLTAYIITFSQKLTLNYQKPLCIDIFINLHLLTTPPPRSMIPYPLIFSVACIHRCKVIKLLFLQGLHVLTTWLTSVLPSAYNLYPVLWLHWQ